jgi:hypothetical protein
VTGANKHSKIYFEDKINSIISSTDGSKHIGALDPKITRNVIGSSTTCS